MVRPRRRRSGTARTLPDDGEIAWSFGGVAAAICPDPRAASADLQCRRSRERVLRRWHLSPAAPRRGIAAAAVHTTAKARLHGGGGRVRRRGVPGGFRNDLRRGHLHRRDHGRDARCADQECSQSREHERCTRFSNRCLMIVRRGGCKGARAIVPMVNRGTSGRNRDGARGSVAAAVAGDPGPMVFRHMSARRSQDRASRAASRWVPCAPRPHESADAPDA